MLEHAKSKKQKRVFDTLSKTNDILTNKIHDLNNQILILEKENDELKRDFLSFSEKAENDKREFIDFFLTKISMATRESGFLDGYIDFVKMK